MPYRLRRCPSCPRSRRSPATCAGTCCPTDGGPGPVDHRRARRVDPDAARRATRTRSCAGVTGPADRGRRAARQAGARRPRRRRVPHRPPQDDRASCSWSRRSLPVDPYERAALTLDDGRELRFRDIRKFGRIGLYGGRRRPVRRDRARAAGRPLHAPGVPALADPRPARPAQAAARRPGVRRGRRQHLRRRGPVAVAAPPAAVGADRCARPTSGASTTASARSSPRPSSGAAPRSTTTRRPTATARCRSASTCTSGRACRAGAAAARSAGSWSASGRPTSARSASGSRRRTGRRRAKLLATMTPRPGPAATGADGPSLDGAGRRGRARAVTRTRRRVAGPGGADATAAATRRAAARATAVRPAISRSILVCPASLISTCPSELHTHFESGQRGLALGDGRGAGGQGA